jgi:hypothetical protein
MALKQISTKLESYGSREEQSGLGISRTKRPRETLLSMVGCGQGTTSRLMRMAFSCRHLSISLLQARCLTLILANSFADRVKDTLKVLGLQVSPMEIEDVCLSHPRKLISDIAVAGVSGGTVLQEKVPRAWIVLSEEGKKLGPESTIAELEKWYQQNLSPFKWLKGGVEVVEQVGNVSVGV